MPRCTFRPMPGFTLSQSNTANAGMCTSVNTSRATASSTIEEKPGNNRHSWRTIASISCAMSNENASFG